MRFGRKTCKCLGSEDVPLFRFERCIASQAMTVQEYVARFLAKQHPDLLEQVARAQDAVDPESKSGQYTEHLPQHEVAAFSAVQSL
jgi:hypothetical protein